MSTAQMSTDSLIHSAAQKLLKETNPKQQSLLSKAQNILSAAESPIQTPQNERNDVNDLAASMLSSDMQYMQHDKTHKQGAVLPGIIKGTGTGLPSHALGLTNENVAVFWDFENCPPPSGMPGYVVVENIRRAVHTFGCVTLFKAYLEITDTTGNKKNLRSELQSSGVSLTDCPHNGRKDAADKMMIVDMLAFALDHPSPATIVLISGDRDFVYALSTLRNRRYTVVLIVPNRGAHIILKSQANVILEWRYDVLNQDIEVLKELGLLELDDSAHREKSESAVHRERSESAPHRERSESRPYRERSDSNRKRFERAEDDRPDWRKNTDVNNGKSSKLVTDSSSPAHHNPYTPLQQKSPEPVATVSLPPGLGPREPKDTPEVSSDSSDKIPEVAPPPGLSGSNLKISMNLEQKGLIASDDLPAFSPRIPHFFDLLVEVLEKFRLEGDAKPKRSKVGNELIRRNPLLYNRANVESFKDYVELALAENLIEVGGEKGNAWITLAKNWREQVYK